MHALPPLNTTDQRTAEGLARKAVEDCLLDEREETTIPINGTTQEVRHWYQLITKHITRWAREILRDQAVTAETISDPDEGEWLTIDFSTGQVIELLTTAALQQRTRADRRRERRFLIHIRIATREQVASVAAAVKHCLNTITKDYRFAYTMPDGSTFGLVLRTKMNAYQLRSAITRGRHDQTTPLTPGDELLILELGTNHADRGMNSVTTWLLQHPTRQ